MTLEDLSQILLVEDDEHDAELTMRALRKSRVLNGIVHVDNGARALDFLFCRGVFAQRPRINPCLVLLDLALPKIGGLEVLTAIRGHPWTRGVPVFVLTQSSYYEDKADAKRLEVNGYLVKPVEFVNFAQVVANAGVNWALVAADSAGAP